jgi:hypothetical protein
MPESANLRLQIEAADADAEELDRLARQLRDEIRELEVEAVELARGGPAPEGSKSPEIVIAGALAITLLPAALAPLTALIGNWAERLRIANRPLTIKLSFGDKLAEVEYDPATTDVHQLTVELMARLAEASAPASHVSLNSQGDVNVGQDVVGRDKINIQVQPGATLVVQPNANPPPPG